MMPDCPLCKNSSDKPLNPSGDPRNYWYCEHCHLITVDARFIPNIEEEKSRYLTHNNDPEDPRYRKFLSQLLVPMIKFLPKSATGLDYGSGSAPSVLQLMLRESGYQSDAYDPLFGENYSGTEFDFITASESFEHFSDPKKEINRMVKVLKPGGILGVMTHLWDDLSGFGTWYYKRDFTHLVFYHLSTFEWLSANYGFEILYTDGSRVIILKKT